MSTNTPPKAHWEPHGTGSRMALPSIEMVTYLPVGEAVYAVSIGKSYPNRFPTQAEAEQFAVETLRGILRDVEERLP